MAHATPSQNFNAQYHAYWGVYDTFADLPNRGGNLLFSPGELDKLQPGDVAYVDADGTRYICTNIGTSGGGDATWVQIATTAVTPQSTVVSTAGKYSVPSAVAVGDLVYITGTFAADRADNSSLSTAPAVGVVIAKPTSTTATLGYFGEFAVFSGLTPGVSYFLGKTGDVTATAPSTAGEVVQRVGVAVDTDTLIFDSELVTVVA